MAEGWARYDLPDRATVARGGDLCRFLDAHRAVSVRISLAAQRRTDTRLLQLLLVARRDWQAAGLGFALAEVPAALSDDIARLDLSALLADAT